MKQKYIIFDSTTAVMFPDALPHRDVASMMHASSGNGWQRKIPTSAGFFYLSVSIEDVAFPEIKVHVYGESDSLNIQSNPNDHQIIAMCLGVI